MDCVDSISLSASTMHVIQIASLLGLGLVSANPVLLERQAGHDLSCPPFVYDYPDLIGGPRPPQRRDATPTTTVTTSMYCLKCGIPATAVGIASPVDGTVTQTQIVCTNLETQASPVSTSSTHYYDGGDLTEYTAMPKDERNPTCTTQAVVDPYIPNQTTTVYKETATYTSTVQCDGCELRWSTGIVNFFAPVVFTATTTATEPTTRVVMACA